MHLVNFFRRALNLYVDGFRNMTVGRKLWVLIIVKCIIFFAVLKLFFFPDILETDYPDDESRAAAVRRSLVSTAISDTTTSNTLTIYE